jgi:FlaA1/EpsC-like NDP-sugar epimerase
MQKVLSFAQAALQKKVDSWENLKRRVVIYGGGTHTSTLFDFIDMKRLSVVAIVDDDSNKWGMEYFGTKIISFDELKGIDFDLILISSLGAEERIYEKIVNNLNIENMEVYRIYG